MSEEKNIAALISLLDDSDKEVYEHVFDKLASFGPSVIPTLENAWSDSFNPTLHERLEELIHKIQFEVLLDDFNKWHSSSKRNLVDGAILLSRYQFPELDETQIRQQLERIKQDVWLELSYNLTPIEQINVFNQVIYGIHSFSANVSNLKDPRHFCLNYVLETKKGNSLSMGILYLIIAQMVDLPVFGVNLPRHFILA